MDRKEVQRKTDEMMRRTQLATPKEKAEVFNYLESKLNEHVGNEIDSLGRVVALLSWDRKNLTIDCYMRELHQDDIFSRLNTSTYRRISYPAGLPNEETYQHGHFVKVKDVFRVRAEWKNKSIRDNDYVALAKGIPVTDLENTLAIRY